MFRYAVVNLRKKLCVTRACVVVLRNVAATCAIMDGNYTET